MDATSATELAVRVTTARELAAQRAAAGALVHDTRLRRKRIEFGLSLNDVAVAVGLSKGGLSQIECGLHEPKVRTALTLARFYETTIEELFGDD